MTRRKDRLLGWDVTNEFDFSPDDQPFGAAVDSLTAVAITQDLAARTPECWGGVEHDVQRRLHQEGDELMKFVATMSVAETCVRILTA
jgi:hypothetical protein